LYFIHVSFKNDPESIIGNTGKAYIHLVFFQVEMPLVMKKKENNEREESAGCVSPPGCLGDAPRFWKTGLAGFSPDSDIVMLL